MKRQTKAEQRAHWMGQFADRLVGAHPALSGRIDWDAATYYFLYGKTVDDAVSEYCIARGIV
jgi:hypothetical protein